MIDVIKTSGLTKSFGPLVALNQISITVREGEIYGFLGLNGAGKTTLIRTLLGMIKPNAGSIHVFEEPLSSHFSQWNNIGYLVETPYAYPNLTVLENLRVVYLLRKLNTPQLIPEIIERLKLTKYQHTKAKVLSLGNQQRLGLAKALMHHPKLLILDEPINGLDPEGIVEVRSLLQDLAASGSTIFLSSHILGEVAKIATRIGIVHEGHLVKELTTEVLNDQLFKKLIVQTMDNEKALALLNEKGFEVVKSGQQLEILDKTAILNPEIIAELLTNNSVSPRQLFLFTEDLEMFFLRTIKSHTHV